MLTRVRIRNFKQLRDVTLDLGPLTVLVGPNNSGKTTALQALALWGQCLDPVKKELERKDRHPLETDAVINRLNLHAVPVRSIDLLWHNREDVTFLSDDDDVGPVQEPMTILVSGEHCGRAWECGLCFLTSNPESMYCTALRTGSGGALERIVETDHWPATRTTFLPPMSGLVAEETEVPPGRINVLIGQGRTAEVVRNLCLQLFERKPEDWQTVRQHLKQRFQVEIGEPLRDPATGTIHVAYTDRNGISLDLASAGRGMLQMLLLLVHMHLHPETVLLLDEPDAHLEILRQREIYQLIADAARKTGAQVIIASHSEVVLEEAAQRDTVIAFVGSRPHRIDDRGSQLVKALRDIPSPDYYQAEVKGWVLYLEGSTDLAFLRAFAWILNHPAAEILADPFVHYVQNQPKKAESHFFGLRVARPDLAGIGIFDHLDRAPPVNAELPLLQWSRREIENYVCTPDILLRFATVEDGGEPGARAAAMGAAIDALTNALQVLKKPSPWSPRTKVTDDFLDPLFERYYASLGLPNAMRKTNYHVLAEFVRPDEIDKEIVEALDAILAAAARAAPVT